MVHRLIVDHLTNLTIVDTLDMIPLYMYPPPTCGALTHHERHTMWYHHDMKAVATFSILRFLVLLLLVSPATSFQSIIANEPRSITTLHSQRNDNSILSDCPFSRTFPRYRIDLTRSSPPEEKKGFNFFGTL